MDVFPDFEGLSGIGDLRQVIGALLTFVLITAVLMLIVGAWTALGAAILAGGGVAWMNWLIDLGRQL